SLFLFLLLPTPLTSTLFPYTTLFRSLVSRAFMVEAQTAPPVSAGRTDGRKADQLRTVRFQNHIAPYATGSTLIEWGLTRVICGVDRKSTRLNSSHDQISYAVFCLKKK